MSRLPEALGLSRMAEARSGLPLAPHQLEAVALGLDRNAVWSLPMGAGKSASAIALAQQADQPCFSMPPAIMATWLYEIAKWSERREVVILRGVHKPRAMRVTFDDSGVPQDEFETAVQPGDWLVLPHPGIVTWQPQINPDLVVFDEIHRLAGYESKAQGYVLALGIQAERCISMSGTLMAGGSHRLWLPCHLGDPKGGWGKYYSFIQRYSQAVDNGYGGLTPSGLSAPQELRDRMAAFLLHYDRGQVGLDLPPHHVVRTQVWLDPQQMRDLAPHGEVLRKYLADRQGNKRSRFLPGEVTQALIALGRATAPAAIPWAQDIVEEGRRVVCWTWHRDVAELLACGLRKVGVTAPVIHGGHTDKVIRNTMALWKSTPSVLCITMAIGGEGWNELALHSSDQIFVELTWLPEILRQCMARLVRPGQVRSVLTRLLYLGVNFQESLVNRLLERHAELGEVLSTDDEAERLLTGVAADWSGGFAALLGRLEL